MTALDGAETIAAGRFLYGKLAAIAGLETGKVFPGAAKRGAVMPYVIYQSFPRPGGEDTDTVDGTRIMARLRFLVKVVAPTLALAEPWVKAVDVALRGQAGQQSGYHIGNVRRVSPFDMPTQEGDELYWQIGGYYDLEVSAGTV
jgi:hypothetical protein